MKRREALRRSLGITGAALSAPLYLSLLSGCAPSGKPDWTSEILDEDQVGTLSAYSNQLFPAGEVPSASDTHVAECVNLVLRDCRSERDQDVVKSALNTLNQTAQDLHGRHFAALDHDQQIKTLTNFEQEVFEEDGAIKSNYIQLKSLVMMAYFTSEEVMKNQLNYNPLPGRHDACIDLGPDSRVFVDNNV